MAKTAYHHGNLREALLLAAREALAQAGVDGLSLRRVARLAGVSATAPYSHFRDKQALLSELAAEGFAELADTMSLAVAEQDVSSGDRLIGLAQGYVSFATRNPALFQLMFGPAVGELPQSPALVAAGTRAYQLMEHAVAERMAEAGTPAQTPVAAAGAWSLVHGLATLLNDGRLRAGAGDLPGQQQLVEAICRLLHFSRPG